MTGREDWSSLLPSPPSLVNFNMVDDRKLDFTKYGSQAKEWKDFVYKNPEEAEGNGLPSDAPYQHAGRSIPKQPEGATDAKKQGLGRSLGHENRARMEEKVIRDGRNRWDRARLTAWVYNRNTYDDELELDGGLPCVVYFHSGGYGLLGEPDTERNLCSEMAARTRVVVVHICYREAPPHKYPDSHHDAQEGLAWVIDNADDLGIDVNQIVLAGMCYGAGLAAALTMQTCAERKDVKLKGLLLGFPWLFQEAMFPYHLFASRGATSRYQCAATPTMSKRTYDDMQRQLGNAEHQMDPLLNIPLAKDAELEKFPRTAFILAGNDILRDDGILFAERLRALGVPRRVHLFPGMPHAFRRYPELWSSQRFDQILMLLVNWCLERAASMDDYGVHMEMRQTKGSEEDEIRYNSESDKEPKRRKTKRGV
ncbi:hypothetical protein DL546_008288 [Coniochaeta pulveracea]|uniref:Alpha/beta hydrolase fold-3 domain-containing protein n=1 Tax=Coniochaeta pulveracea TaxID=177199 RepID=A0A420YMU1_9PEZI|nr:hypothetical protein DL546_008288 [Coniochaeta pulveracea]